jgi:hypothetical protein
MSVTMNLPKADFERWQKRLAAERPSAVLRDMAIEYQVTKSTLGFFLVDLWPYIGTPGVQAVWGWDIKGTGKGLTDEALDEELAELRAEREPQPK